MRQQPTMLLIDDDGDFVADLEPMLTQSGYTVVTAPQAALALEYLHQQPVDIIVSDLHMPPGINGHELLQRLRAERNNVPVILMSSSPAGGYDSATLPVADDYLKKPFRIDDLVSRVEALLLQRTNQQMTADQCCAIMGQPTIGNRNIEGREGETMRKTLIGAAPLILGIIVAIIFQLTPGVLFLNPTQVPVNIGYVSIGSGIVLSLILLGAMVLFNRQGRQWNEENRRLQIDMEKQIADARSTADSQSSQAAADLRQQIADLKQQNADLLAHVEQTQLTAQNQTAKLSDEAAEAVRQAEHKAVKARHDFYKRLDHEVKQPLQRLQSAADNLYRSVGITQGEPKNYYLRITNEIKLVDSMIEDLRKLAEMASDKQPFAPERLSLGELLAEVVGEAKSNDPRATTRDIQLNLPDFPEQPPPDILGEPYNLTRVFRNLLDNAIKYTEANGKIRVKVYASKQRDKVIVEVIDNGRGIPANELEQVWEEFYRASNAGNDGRGMGLALVRIAIERHGGDRSIERLGPSQSGTRAILTFPAISTTADTQQHTTHHAERAVARQSPMGAEDAGNAEQMAQPREDAVGDPPRSPSA